ncbi:hypothetical protein GCM10023189_37450 [Nibrella saemangeumensis]|uniref:dUTPase-like domain-containing protein n=1 Tax=Nibrella saemangeumensis TaxID=1084526 RepID=A0ABP8N5K8_9BACT
MKEDAKEWDTALSPIQPTSIDVRVKNIFIPGKKKKSRGGSEEPLDQSSIATGGTVIVETMETLSLPSNISAIVFPPNSVSSKGILVTNPGHIDPGYEGNIKFTLLNMSKEPFALKRGDVIGTILFFLLDSDVRSDYKSRVKQTDSNKGIQDLNETLAHDFVNINERIKEKLNKELTRYSLITTVIVGLLGVLATTASTYLNNSSNAKFSERLRTCLKMERWG